MGPLAAGILEQMTRPSLRVLTWNVAGRVRSVDAQAAALATHPADVVLLQEVRSTATAAWTDALGRLGHPYVLASLPAGPPDVDAARRLGVVVAARAPLDPIEPPPLPWPERHLAALLTIPGGPVELHAVHAPVSARSEQVKVRTLEALAGALARDRPHPVLLGGDLNTPQYESREGEVRSFARTRTGRLRDGFDERHDQAELGVVPGLRDHGYVDAFREVHGYGARDRSWMYANGRTGYRLDHLLARGLEVRSCAYVHVWREDRLSDHSALWAEVALPGTQPTRADGSSSTSRTSCASPRCSTSSVAT